MDIFFIITTSAVFKQQAGRVRTEVPVIIVFLLLYTTNQPTTGRNSFSLGDDAIIHVDYSIPILYVSLLPNYCYTARERQTRATHPLQCLGWGLVGTTSASGSSSASVVNLCILFISGDGDEATS